MYATITSKGQVTLPKPLRKRLQLAPGDRIEFVLEEGDHVRLVVKRAGIGQLKGILARPQHPVSLEQMERAIEAGGRRS